MRNKLLSRVIAASLPFVAAACAAMHGDPTTLPRAAVVYFFNDAIDPADVYVITSSKMRSRIGTVMPGQTEALPIPDVISGAGDVTIVARLSGPARFISSGPVTLSANDRYSVRLVSTAPELLILPASKRDILAAERRRP